MQGIDWNQRYSSSGSEALTKSDSSERVSKASSIVPSAGVIISIQSRKYNNFLFKLDPNYYFPTILEIVMNTTILTFILLIGKILIEKAFYTITEQILDKKIWGKKISTRKK